MVNYEKIEGDFYETQTKSFNPLRSWFHSSRHKIISKLVSKNYSEGKIVADFGCGNCIWNDFNAKVIGIDINNDLAQQAMEKKRIMKIINSDFLDTNIKNASIDVVVCSEVLEHLQNFKEILLEQNRVLKKNGSLIISVPYDTNLSLWKWMFKAQCFIQGQIFGNEYYKKECGHINHFSPQKISQDVENAGFKIIQIFHNKYMTIFIEAKKP